jgi:hypothetical protein
VSAGCDNQPIPKDIHACSAFPFEQLAAHLPAPHIDLLHFYVFEQRSHSLLVVNLATDPLSQTISAGSHGLHRRIVRFLARFQFL